MLKTSDGHTYVIAEIGANHNGDMDLARETIRAAKAAGGPDKRHRRARRPSGARKTTGEILGSLEV